jgi:hypothetical protein
MRASQLRLLPVLVCVVAGAVAVPATAIAEPAPTTAVHAVQVEAPVVHQAQMISEEPTPAPPLWLLLLLAPVLIGGAVGVGVTLRRLR